MCIIPEAVTVVQATSLVEELDPVLKRRRYERNHWDQVIIGYKEVERPVWNVPMNVETIANVRRQVDALVRTGSTAVSSADRTLDWLPVHFIDLAPDGYITPHVDSTKFSGDIVCGLSLLSPSVMTLTHESDIPVLREGEKRTHCVAAAAGLRTSTSPRLFLSPRSLYVLSGDARFKFAHSIARNHACEQPERNKQAEIVFGLKGASKGRRISLIFRDASDRVQRGLKSS